MSTQQQLSLSRVAAGRVSRDSARPHRIVHDRDGEVRGGGGGDQGLRACYQGFLFSAPRPGCKDQSGMHALM
jgi:hypothetical protein